MKPLLTFISCIILACGVLPAQGTFRIFDSQMNDVTDGVMYIADTNVAMIQVDLVVENIDSLPHSVTAGRLVLTQPAGASNAFTWDVTNYPPAADSSAFPVAMAAGVQDSSFEGYYFPNSTGGIATINYCFWETTDMNNYNCVTVTFDHFYPAGINGPVASPAVSFFPDPAPYEIGVGWSGFYFTTVNLYSSDGKLVESRDVRGRTECGFEVSELASGIYLISCIDVRGETFNSRFVHSNE